MIRITTMQCTYFKGNLYEDVLKPLGSCYSTKMVVKSKEQPQDRVSLTWSLKPLLVWLRIIGINLTLVCSVL